MGVNITGVSQHMKIPTRRDVRTTEADEARRDKEKKNNNKCETRRDETRGASCENILRDSYK